MSQFTISDIGYFPGGMAMIDQAQKNAGMVAKLVVYPRKLGDATVSSAMIADGSIKNAAIAAAEIDNSMRPVQIRDMVALADSLHRRGKRVLLVTAETRELLDRTFDAYQLSEFPFNGIKPDLCIWDETTNFPTDRLRGMSPDEWRKQFECDFDGEPSKEEIDKEHAKYCREMRRRERAAASRSPSSRPWERF